MPRHSVGTREQWQAARERLLQREKQLTHENDELARQRRELPWVALEKDYAFDTEEGAKTLAQLFAGRSQLLIYHFMFGPRYDAGCPVCSSAADTFDRALPHLAARDVSFLCASRAPLEKLQAYRRRMGWSFPWVSSQDSDFNYDFGVSFTEEQLRPFLEGELGPVGELAGDCGTDPAGYMAEGPGLSAFALEEGVVYHTYSTYRRGLECLMGYYPLLDRAPRGRAEGEHPRPWMRRHDEYPGAPAGAA
jgi:predicted dithiol-disulfide oxidoreductase (DUF899 family)